MAFGFTTKAKTVGVAVNSLTTVGLNTTGANWMAIHINCSIGVTPNTPTDLFGNTWTLTANSPQSINSQCHTYVWVAENATSGLAHTFTCSFAAAATDVFSFDVIGFSGRATSSSVEGLGYAGSAASTSHTGPSTGTLSATTDDIAMFIADNNFANSGNNSTWTPAGSFTAPAAGITSDGRDQWCSGVMYWANTGSTTSVATSFTSTTSDVAGIFVLAVKAPGGASTHAGPLVDGALIKNLVDGALIA